MQDNTASNIFGPGSPSTARPLPRQCQNRPLPSAQPPQPYRDLSESTRVSVFVIVLTRSGVRIDYLRKIIYSSCLKDLGENYSTASRALGRLREENGRTSRGIRGDFSTPLFSQFNVQVQPPPGPLNDVEGTVRSWARALSAQTGSARSRLQSVPRWPWATVSGAASWALTVAERVPTMRRRRRLSSADDDKRKAEREAYRQRSRSRDS